ncbi:MAG: DM13 domain-containing protein [Acidimicrobiia bacterium]|nr:DM13 domain-containing protein [Acidimicrobiia bacterium]
MELIRRFKWPIIGAGAVVLVVGFLLFRPDKLFVDDTVNESLSDAFPVAAADTQSSSTTTTTTTTTTTAAPAEADESETASTDTTTTTTTTLPPEPAGPVAIGTGSFYGIDHSAEGTATVYELEGDFVLRFEDDTDIQNGPDLWVWVLAADSYDGGDPGEFIELGKIKGNVGGQNYELPPEFDPEVHQFVLIWCKRFSVPFAASPLA